MLILVIEDDLGISELIKNIVVASDYEVAFVHTSEEALFFIEERTPGLMLLDFGLPDMNGREFINELKQKRLTIPPFIVTTGLGDEQVAVEMMKLGAKDYIVKDTEYLELIPIVVKRVVAEIRVEQKRMEAEEELARQSETLNTIFENAPYILVLVNEEGRVENINHKGVAFSGKNKDELLGMLGGDVFNCINSFDGKGCGKNSECTDCPIRLRVEHTYTTGEARIEEEGSMTFVINGQEIVMDLQISTNPVNIRGKQMVLLTIADVTERRYAEEELRKSESMLNKAQEIAHIGNWELDIVSGKLFWSDEVYRLFGLKPQQFDATYEAFLDNIHPDDRDYINNAYTESLKTKTPYNIDHRLLLADGTLKYVNDRCETSYDRQGDPVRSLGTIRDITLEKQTEKALLEANTIINRSPAVAFLWKVEEGWPVEFVSENVERLCGYSAADFLTRKISYADIIYTDDIERIADEVKLFGKMPDRQSFTHKSYRLISKNGKIVWVDDTSYIRRNSEGSITHYEGIVIDITERKRDEESLRILSSAIRQSPVSIVITDTNGMIEYVNPYFCRLAGYSIDEIIGENPRILKSGHTQEDEYNELWHTISSGNDWRSVFHNKKKNGELYWESAVISPVMDDKGKITHFLAVKEDITERIRTEEKIKQLNESLEQKVVDRTADLDEAVTELKFENDERKRAEVHLREANETKDKFFSIIAHDLKNPLQILISSSYLLEAFFEKQDYEKIGKHIQRIIKSVNGLNNLLENLLTWARSQRGSIAYNPLLTDLSLLLSRHWELLKVNAEKKKIDLSFDVPEDTKIMADGDMLSIIVVNLIQNALKFTAEGGKVNLSSKVSDNLVEISVRDTGIGMSGEDVAKLFRIDTHFTTPGTSNEKGSGLGLIICMEFIEKHNGKIWAESEPDKGSTFYFTLPKA